MNLGKFLLYSFQLFFLLLGSDSLNKLDLVIMYCVMKD